MVLPISNLFRRNPTAPRTSPLMNSTAAITGSNPRSSYYGGPNYNFRKFWLYFKDNVEIVRTVSIPVTDVIGDRPYWTDLEDNPLSGEELKKAQEFWSSNHGKEEISGFLYDKFTTGNGYIWKGYADKDAAMKKIKEVMKIYQNSGKFQTKESQNSFMIKAMQSPELTTIKKFCAVASSTINIINDEYGIIGYTQNVNGITKTYSPEELIHSKFMYIDGKVYGFTPVEALVAEVMMLQLIKENYLAYLRNGGSPSKIFILPEEIAGSDNHEFLVQTLQRYQMVQNRNGNLVLTGKVDMKELNSIDEKMQGRELAVYVASKFAYGFGIPPSRLPPFLQGVTSGSGDSGGLTDAGYWKMISSYQDDLEDCLNWELFSTLGWKIHLPRPYKQDEVREAQIANMTVDTLTKMNTFLASQKKRIKEDRIPKLLFAPTELTIDDLEEIPDDELMLPQQKTGLMNQNLLDNVSLEKEPDNRKRADTKRNVANEKQNKGLSV